MTFLPLPNGRHDLRSSFGSSARANLLTYAKDQICGRHAEQDEIINTVKHDEQGYVTIVFYTTFFMIEATTA